MSQIQQRRIILGLMFFAFFLLACGSTSVGQVTPPGGAVKVSSAASEELEKNVRNQIFDLTKKDFRLTMTNEQVTSFVNLKGSNMPLENPQIWFTQGKAFIRGSFTFLCLFHPEVQIVLSPKVKDNKIQANVQQIYVGALQVPQSWLDNVSKSIADSIDEAQINLYLDKIEIREGELIVSGAKTGR